MTVPSYPWYRLVSGAELEQGDILESCTVFIPPEEVVRGETPAGMFEGEERDLIVLSQTCDLVSGREKVSDVLLCPIWDTAQFKTGHLSTPKGLEEVRRGVLPGYHLVAACDLANYRRSIRLVEFRQTYSLPLSFVRKQAEQNSPRIRLLPPYREHLSQSFARFFMRVGLPADIPAFK